ncbi:MAG: hypothetical protein NTW32_20435 [Chloroflexi bacterium]|nr:hypothetical protein [Chloroflexota bacterium]
MKRIWITFTLVILGLLLCGSAVFAFQLGFDHNTGWGISRYILLVGGFLLFGLAVLFWHQDRILDQPSGSLLSNLPGWNRRLPILAVLSGLLIVISYVFFISLGRWTFWPEISQNYDMLGTGFRAGHLYLDNVPTISPALLTLPDPYDPDARNAVPEAEKSADSVWDLTLYKGKLYLYWGPVPAVFLAGIKLFYSGPIADQYLAFAFLVGLLIFSILIILQIRQKFFQDVPVFLVVVCILAAGLVCPLPWMLGTAAIYEATILGGQFFLVGGLYFAISAIESQSTALLKPILAVTFWMLAAGTRTILLVPAAFLTLLIILWNLRNDFDTKRLVRALPKAVPLGLPLAAGIMLYGWYNWARFGSVFETGLRYTITFLNLNADINKAFSFNHFFASLWVFLLNPIDVRQTFPFLQALYGKFPAVLDFGQVLYWHSERISGILISVPFVYFAGVSGWNTISSLSGKITHKRPAHADPRQAALLWISLCLGVSCLLTFAALQLYFNLAMRFIADFIPSLMLFSIIGVFQGYRALQGKTNRQRLFIFLVIILAIATITLSFFLAMSQNYNQFQKYNRHLLKDIIQFFGG